MFGISFTIVLWHSKVLVSLLLLQNIVYLLLNYLYPILKEIDIAAELPRNKYCVSSLHTSL